jgi:hypothetical protein
MGFCKKKKNISDQEQKNEELGTKWIWTAIDSSTKLLFCFLIGDRTLTDGQTFLNGLTTKRIGDRSIIWYKS